MASGTFYLRPSADVSLEHSVYPDTLTVGYLAISEEVSDGETTYLAGNGTATLNKTSTFAFSGIVPSTPIILQEGGICLDFTVPTTHGGASQTNVFVNFYIEGVEVGSYSEQYSIGAGNAKIIDSAYYILTDEAIEIINNHLTVNKSLPDIQVSVRFYMDYSTNSKGSGGGVGNLTQMYVELSYDEVLSIYTKSNGTWQQARKAYQKQSGVWVETSETECKDYLSSHLIIDKCAYRGHVEVPIPDIAATCTETGMTGGIDCKFCGNHIKDHDVVIPALGHNEVASAGTATCTEDGMIGGTKCSRCGITLKEHDTVQPALGHDLVSYETKATCTKDGVTGGIKCSRCDYIEKEPDTVIPALGHDFSPYTGYCKRSSCYTYHPDSFTFTIQRNTTSSASTLHAMPNLTWGEWADGQALYWEVTAEGSIRYLLDLGTYGKTEYIVDGVKADDIIIAGHAYTATDVTT